ncbi:MAG: DUF1707 and DUF4190 domain-containing protein [Gemmatimonadales bacterium]
MTAVPDHGAAAGGSGALRASDADREHAIDVFNAAFAEGRLTTDEHGTRVQDAYGARSVAELAALTADLPAGPPAPPSPSAPVAYLPATAPPRTNPLALASLVCGLIQVLPATIAAIVLGIQARRQIQHTDQPGAALATAGLALGMFWVLLTIIAVLLL